MSENTDYETLKSERDSALNTCSLIAEALGITGAVAGDTIAKVQQLVAESAALKAENCIQDFIISAVKDLVRESDGVTGWHRNGDVATWDEVLPAQRREQLVFDWIQNAVLQPLSTCGQGCLKT